MLTLLNMMRMVDRKLTIVDTMEKSSVLNKMEYD